MPSWTKPLRNRFPLATRRPARRLCGPGRGLSSAKCLNHENFACPLEVPVVELTGDSIASFVKSGGLIGHRVEEGVLATADCASCSAACQPRAEARQPSADGNGWIFRHAKLRFAQQAPRRAADRPGRRPDVQRPGSIASIASTRIRGVSRAIVMPPSAMTAFLSGYVDDASSSVKRGQLFVSHKRGYRRHILAILDRTGRRSR